MFDSRCRARVVCLDDDQMLRFVAFIYESVDKEHAGIPSSNASVNLRMH